jgi:outer membrane protein
MKRLVLIAAFLLTAGAISAQNYIVVDSEKIFKSIDAYNKAIAELDNLAEEYQKLVEAKFEAVETLYNNYVNQKASLSAATRQAHENTILTREKEAQEYQESIFGKEGTLMKRRKELIEPIQKRVFAAIESYAAQTGADAVIDSANNPTLLYTAARVERTQQIIALLAK